MTMGAFCVALGLTTQAFAQVLMTDEFEVDTSANYTLMSDDNAPSGDGVFDGSVVFNYDYSLQGVPSAPRSTGGTTRGLIMTVNDTEEGPDGPSAAEEDHVTAFNTTAINAPSYRLDVDIFMGVDLGQSGTTEFAHVGVAGDGLDFNSIFTPIAGSGYFMSMTGEGGSSSDYRHSTPTVLAVPSGDSSYLNPENTTNASSVLYQGLFPSPPSDVQGSPTNIWTTLSITVADKVTYWLDGTPIIQTDNVGADGFVSLGYTDPFDSVGPHFVVYDNLTVTVIPEPSTLLLVLAALVVLGVARRKG
jgi:hypothetical protein